jgi:hypothetical protein
MILDVWQRKGLPADFPDVWQGKELEDEKEVEEGKEVEDVKEEKRADEAVRKLAGVRPFASGALYKSFEAQDKHFEAQCKRSRLILFRGAGWQNCTKVQKCIPALLHARHGKVWDARETADAAVRTRDSMRNPTGTSKSGKVKDRTLKSEGCGTPLYFALRFQIPGSCGNRCPTRHLRSLQRPNHLQRCGVCETKRSLRAPHRWPFLVNSSWNLAMVEVVVDGYVVPLHFVSSVEV